MQDDDLTVEDINNWYPWDAHKVYQIDQLVEKINQGDWYKILKKHIKCGNSKIHKNTWIFSISPATDCPHLNGEQCQVPKDACYAYKSEQQYEHPINRKRRLTVIWDLLDPATFAETLIEIKARKTSTVDIDYLRLNEAGDIRCQQDVHKANEIARILKDRVDVQTYLYSATYKNPQTDEPFDWPAKDERTFTLMASNDHVEPHADTRFKAVVPEEISDDDIVCPAELHGRDTIKCGSCTLCPEGNVDEILVPLH